jgi:hypothetical protein
MTCNISRCIFSYILPNNSSPVAPELRDPLYVSHACSPSVNASTFPTSHEEGKHGKLLCYMLTNRFQLRLIIDGEAYKLSLVLQTDKCLA